MSNESRVIAVASLLVFFSQACTFIFDDGNQSVIVPDDGGNVTADAEMRFAACPELEPEAGDDLGVVELTTMNNPVNGNCYAFYNNRFRNADESEQACIRYSPDGTEGHLVSITSETEYEFVKTLTGFRDTVGDMHHENFWIGLNDKANEDDGALEDNFVFTNGDTLPLLDDPDSVPEPERWKRKWHKWNRTSGQENGVQPNDFKAQDNGFLGEDCVWQLNQAQLWLDISCGDPHKAQILCEFKVN